MEIEKGEKLEEQLAAAQAKCSELLDKCDVRSLTCVMYLAVILNHFIFLLVEVDFFIKFLL